MNMDDLDKLSCKEEIFEVSDVEPNASDDSKINEGKTKKRRRRRREVDLMSEGDETEETEDEGLNKKLYRRLSPAPGPHSPASHREPRTCVLKAKGIPLSKDETKALLRLIESSRILASRGINAATNRMKVVEWKRITEAFNATAAASRRSPRQLRLKWENLKKNSRKRSSLIRINSSQTESDARRHIGPDDILDRVAGLLDGAGSGLDVPMNAKRKYRPMQDIPMQDKPMRDKPMRDKLMRDKPMRNKPVQDDWVAARNRALTEYYITKKQYILAKMNNLLLENTKLKLEVESLKRDRSES